MTVCLKNANIFLSDGVCKGSVVYDDVSGRILSVCGENDIAAADSVIDAKGGLLIPGLVDVHTHGRAGHDFNFASKEEMKEMSRSYMMSGVTTLLPTLASAEYEALIRSSDTISEIISDENSDKNFDKNDKNKEPDKAGAHFAGVHLEGRYLNPLKRGAHRPDLLVKPNAGEIAELMSHMSGAVHISAAYELEGGAEFAKKALELGATLGLAHTNATYAEALEAEKNGVTSYTHLMNAMPPLHQREGGAVCAALTGDKYCELICDGFHVKPEMVRLIYKLTGVERLVLITDSMEATGCRDGNYSIAGMPVTVKNGKAYTTDGAIAGSTLSLIDGVKNLTEFCGARFEDAVKCASENPAKMVGIFDEVGSIQAGKRADMLLLNPETYDIDMIICNGIQHVPGECR